MAKKIAKKKVKEKPTKKRASKYNIGKLKIIGSFDDVKVSVPKK
jgi:hypothetical protein